jgi:hypothetical protein
MGILRKKLDQMKSQRKLTFEFDYFRWTFLLAHVEDLKVAENCLFCLGVSIHLHAQEVTLVLPKHL